MSYCPHCKATMFTHANATTQSIRLRSKNSIDLEYSFHHFHRMTAMWSMVSFKFWERSRYRGAPRGLLGMDITSLQCCLQDNPWSGRVLRWLILWANTSHRRINWCGLTVRTSATSHRIKPFRDLSWQESFFSHHRLVSLRLEDVSAAIVWTATSPAPLNMPSRVSWFRGTPTRFHNSNLSWG